MSLEPWKLEDPFERLIRRNLEARNKVSPSIEAILRLCSSKYKHLQVIWARLAEEAVVSKASLEILNRRLTQAVPSTSETTGPKALNREEAIAFQAHHRSLDLYGLDYEDLLIHSKILLDRIAFLVSQIYDGKVLLARGFAKQRRYFLDPTCIVPKEIESYGRYIRERTKWFGPLLNVYRNEFVIHNEFFAPFGTIDNPGRPPRLIMRTFIESHNTNSLFKKLKALKDEYAPSIPGLANVHDNFYELLDFFETHSESLTKQDMRILDEIRRSVGAKLPDPNEIANHLLEFVGFVEAQFLKPLENPAAGPPRHEA